MKDIITTVIGFIKSLKADVLLFPIGIPIVIVLCVVLFAAGAAALAAFLVVVMCIICVLAAAGFVGFLFFGYRSLIEKGAKLGSALSIKIDTLKASR